MSKEIHTLGDLKKSKYKPKSIRQEIRGNLINSLTSGIPLFADIHGYEDTVLPDVERALLSGHNILLLGLRGQAKTKIARMITQLLDDKMPIIAGSEINDDPFAPVSKFAKEQILHLGDKTPIEWISKSQRYVEKLATPDVSISDLIGDLDPIKAANMKISYSDELAIHYGLIPRSNRCIFVLNELSDLQPRIQVSLFNILEEKDLQIRGFKVKLPLDILFIFTANPEDYTQRGNIITPLKDRIESQILTHYPFNIDTAMKITEQEINIDPQTKKKIKVDPLILKIIERIVQCARISEYVDEKSGVSARLSIAALELLYSTVERRMVINGEKSGSARISDLLALVPSITGKIELVYEGEQLGPYDVALHLINEAIMEESVHALPEFPKAKNQKPPQVYQYIAEWFSQGNTVELELTASETAYQTAISNLNHSFFDSYISESKNNPSLGIIKELVLHKLAGFNIIQKEWFDQRIQFKDQLASMLDDLDIQNN